MALSLVKKSPSSGSMSWVSGLTAVSTTFDSATTTGNTILAFGASWKSGGAPTYTFSDNQGNGNYTQIVTRTTTTQSNADRAEIAAKLSANGGATHTVTLTASGASDLLVAAIEMSGCATTDYAVAFPSSDRVSNDSVQTPVAGVTTTGGDSGSWFFHCVSWEDAVSNLVMTWTGSTQRHFYSANAISGSVYSASGVSGSQSPSLAFTGVDLDWAVVMARMEAGQPSRMRIWGRTT